MLKNRDVFYKDPVSSMLPNDGVSEVTEPRDKAQWDILAYELETFVCDGAYKVGLDRILSTFLTNLGNPKQPAAWVSGFYGSGKSHLVRVLEFLWRDVQLPGGASARSLVNLPPDIKDLLKELTNRGKQDGGLWSAAGRLGADAPDSVRLALLRIIFRSAGLPEDYPIAQFVLWLEKSGWYDQVKLGVEQRGKVWSSELKHLYVSPIVAQSLLAAHPSFADTEAQVHLLLRTQFPTVKDISEDDMFTTMNEVFARQSTTPGRLPLVLIVLDELQQYLGDNNDKIQAVGLVTESCSSRFGSRLLFVATGQSALAASPQIARLKDRFSTPVELSDADVDKVIREVVLRKKPSHAPEVQAALVKASGEVDRQLLGTKIGAVAEDKDVWVADYPLLPVRRRFWEKVLRAIDRAGAAGQLRTQLKVVHEAVREVADEKLGFVVPADRIYNQQCGTMIQTGVLLREVHETIAKLDDGSAAGKLRSRILSTIFLINQVSAADSNVGLRANAETLADLLVEDIEAGSAGLRQEIPDVIQALLDNGNLMQVGTEYRLQTKESAEWEQTYRGHYQKIFNDAARIIDCRTTELRNACKKQLSDLSFVHGNSKTPRKAELYFGSDQPNADAGTIPVWIRDEWSVSEAQVRQDSQAAGVESPVVFVFLPRRNADDLKKALAGYEAATATLGRPVPTTPGGIEAKLGMTTRQQSLRTEINTNIATILKDARVYQGGGNELGNTELNAAVKAASEVALARLYPQFSIGDDPKWNIVINRAKQGNGDPLSVLGYTGNASDHPTCLRILTDISSSGTKGNEILKKYTGTVHGWPKDAVDGALYALLAAGNIQAYQDSQAIVIARLEQNRIGTTEFRRQVQVVTMTQKVMVRGLLTAADITFVPNNEVVAVPSLLTRLKDLASHAGGLAPLPQVPSTSHIDTLLTMSGNDQLIAVAAQKDVLSQQLGHWKDTKALRDSRIKRWEVLQTLLRFADGLPIRATAESQCVAINTNRSLLASPDPISPIITDLSTALREAVTTARQCHLDEYDKTMSGLMEDPNWQRLSPAQQNTIRQNHELGTLEPLKISTEEDLLDTLAATPLDSWKDKTAALTERISRARLQAIQLLKPTAVRVKLPNASLETEQDVQTYLDQVREVIMAEINAGKPVTV